MGEESRSRVLVTGGSGFIGRRLVRALLGTGARVTVADSRAFPDEAVESIVKDSFVPRLMRAARDGTGVQIYGDGTQVRDLVHVDDIIAGILIAWRARCTGPLILGAGESVPVNDILDAARSVTGAGLPAENTPPKAGEMPAVIVDISAARALGYHPQHDLKSGLATVWPEFSEAAQ